MTKPVFSHQASDRFRSISLQLVPMVHVCPWIQPPCTFSVYLLSLYILKNFFFQGRISSLFLKHAVICRVPTGVFFLGSSSSCPDFCIPPVSPKPLAANHIAVPISSSTAYHGPCDGCFHGSVPCLQQLSVLLWFGFIYFSITLPGIFLSLVGLRCTHSLTLEDSQL